VWVNCSEAKRKEHLLLLSVDEAITKKEVPIKLVKDVMREV
jgi:hypothetical protein